MKISEARLRGGTENDHGLQNLEYKLPSQNMPISILPNLENGARLAAKENKTNIKLNWSQHRLIAQLGKSHSARYIAVKDLQATL